MKSRDADAFRADPRVAKAKELLLEALEEYQGRLTAARPPIKELEENYKSMIGELVSMRGGELFFPYIGSGLGCGPYVELMDGSVKLDFISGIGPHFFGHSYHGLISAGIDAAISDTVMQGHLQQNHDVLEITRLLIESSGFDHCFLTTSGAMANENALKIAFQKQYPRNRVLAFEKCFMGRSITLSSITDKPEYRVGLPLDIAVDYVPFYDEQHEEESIERSAEILRRHIERYPNQHAVMSFELVQGEGGFFYGTTRYFQTLMEICREHGITVLVDEVQTFGRTTELFAFQTFNLQDYVDLVTIGKLSQVCATLFTKAYRPKPGLLSQTFSGCTAALHASKAILELLTRENYYGPDGKIEQLSQYFKQSLANLEKKYPKAVAGPYGIGAMIAFTPFGGDAQLAKKALFRLYENGLMGFIAGKNPSRIRFLIPAGVVSRDHIDEAIKIIDQTLLSMI